MKTALASGTAKKKSTANKKSTVVVIEPFVEDGNPSEVTNAVWIAAFYKGKKKMLGDKGRVGKWLMFLTEKYVDDTWRNVKKAIEAGQLWKAAKVSTALGSGGGSYVLCVYTHDHEDEKDVMRIRETLREMGFKRSVTYKTDDQTHAGIYSDNTQGIKKYKA